MGEDEVEVDGENTEQKICGSGGRWIFVPKILDEVEMEAREAIE